MSSNKTQISPKPKPSLANKAWAYISIAGALVAIIYAGLSFQEQPNPIIPDRVLLQETTVSQEDSVRKEATETFFKNPQDPSH